MEKYWETGMAQKYKGRTQQAKFKRDAEKRGKFAGWGSKIGGFLFGAPGNYFGGEIGGMLSGVDRGDITGGDEDWYLDTRKATMQGIDDIGMNDAIERLKQVAKMGLNIATGGASGGIESMMGGGGGGGDISSLLSSFGGGGGGGGTSTPSFGDFSSDLMDGNYGANMSSGGGGGDSMLGRVMSNVEKEIPEGMDINTFLVHKKMFPELTPQEAAEQYGIPLDQYIAQLMNLGKTGMSLGSTGRMGG